MLDKWAQASFCMKHTVFSFSAAGLRRRIAPMPLPGRRCCVGRGRLLRVLPAGIDGQPGGGSLVHALPCGHVVLGRHLLCRLPSRFVVISSLGVARQLHLPCRQVLQRHHWRGGQQSPVGSAERHHGGRVRVPGLPSWRLLPRGQLGVGRGGLLEDGSDVR